MPCPHFEVSIVKRSDDKSAVASAAYQSGMNLFSEYQQKWKRYADKPGVLHAEIMLPENAPDAYRDRATLWNSVEKAETQWNAQLARRVIMALPIEECPACPQSDHGAAHRSAQGTIPGNGTRILSEVFCGRGDVLRLRYPRRG